MATVGSNGEDGFIIAVADIIDPKLSVISSFGTFSMPSGNISSLLSFESL